MRNANGVLQALFRVRSESPRAPRAPWAAPLLQEEAYAICVRLVLMQTLQALHSTVYYAHQAPIPARPEAADANNALRGPTCISKSNHHATAATRGPTPLN